MNKHGKKTTENQSLLGRILHDCTFWIVDSEHKSTYAS